MHVIAVVGNKGGSGKSTLSRHLAVAGVEAGQTVLLLDADAQQSAAETWARVRDLETPVVVQTTPDKLERMLDGARKEGVDLVVVDTPPASGRASLTAIKAADLVLVPVRPSLDDVAPTAITRDLLKFAPGAMAKTVAVINAVPPQGKGLADEAEEALEDLGFTVAPQRISARNAFIHAANAGRTVAEVRPKDEGATEMARLWAFVSKRLKSKKGKS